MVDKMLQPPMIAISPIFQIPLPTHHLPGYWCIEGGCFDDSHHRNSFIIYVLLNATLQVCHDPQLSISLSAGFKQSPKRLRRNEFIWVCSLICGKGGLFYIFQQPSNKRAFRKPYFLGRVLKNIIILLPHLNRASPEPVEGPPEPVEGTAKP